MASVWFRPSLLKLPLGFAIKGLGKPVQDIRGLVHPAEFFAPERPNLAERFPEEAEGSSLRISLIDKLNGQPLRSTL